MIDVPRDTKGSGHPTRSLVPVDVRPIIGYRFMALEKWCFIKLAHRKILTNDPQIVGGTSASPS
jgi:hypothetical protein